MAQPNLMSDSQKEKKNCQLLSIYSFQYSRTAAAVAEVDKKKKLLTKFQSFSYNKQANERIFMLYFKQ